MRAPFLLASLFAYMSGFTQTVEETYPKTLWCPNDSFGIRYETYPRIDYYTCSRTNKSSPGTDASPGNYVTFYYGKDSLRVNYHNKIPYAHIIFLNFESPKGKTTLRFHFNDITNFFPAGYVQKNMNNTQFDIPESYELANIIWTLSPSGQRATDLYKGDEYYDRVMKYFKPWMSHPIFKELDVPDSIYYDKYYDFRENSFAFNFKEPGSVSNTQLLFNGPYYYVFGNELADSSFFGKLKPLVEDFAAKTKFRQFYKNNSAYYKKAIRREEALLPLKKMWAWLEDQFPGIEYQSYRVVFSPLIGGSHSTQRYTTYHDNKRFAENVMFICGTGRYDTVKSYNETQREGLMSGIVFTEIDHNYVNPTTNKFGKSVDSIFSRRDYWVKEGVSKNYYGSPYAVFNEYMTHAVFCLYVDDSYDRQTADLVIQKREEMNAGPRNFVRFREFNRELLRLHRENKAMKVAQLYPLMLEWCRKQG